MTGSPEMGKVGNPDNSSFHSMIQLCPQKVNEWWDYVCLCVVGCRQNVPGYVSLST